MDICKTVRLIGRWGRKVAPTACAVGGAIGVVATGYSAAKAGKEVGTYEAVNGPMPVKKKIRTYAKPAILGVTSIALIFTGDRIHAHRYAALGAAANLIQNNYDSYREAAKAVCGNGEKWDDSPIQDKKDELESNTIWDLCRKNGIDPIDTHTGEKLWYEPLSMQFFLASSDHVTGAIRKIREDFDGSDHAQFGDFLTYLEIETEPGYFNIGWDVETGSKFYGYDQVEIMMKDKKLRDGTEYVQIAYAREPHLSEK